MIFDAVAQHRSGSTLSMKGIQKTIEGRRAATNTSPPLPMDHPSNPMARIEGQLPILEEAENFLVAEAMRKAGNNQGIAASLLGISRPALNRRLNRHLRHLIDQKS